MSGLMTKLEMTETIMVSKAKLGLSWAQIAESVGLNEVFVTSACLGMNSLKPAYAEKLCAALALSEEVKQALEDFPHKSWDKAVPTDPLIYRLYEIVGVYGPTMKALIHEKFGDGIMSAIDFSMHIDKEPNPLGDRVVVTMNGKFLPYKDW
jgi:cyanate lyase